MALMHNSWNYRVTIRQNVACEIRSDLAQFRIDIPSLPSNASLRQPL
jgi:hypothetical protein